MCGWGAGGGISVRHPFKFSAPFPLADTCRVEFQPWCKTIWQGAQRWCESRTKWQRWLRWMVLLNFHQHCTRSPVAPPPDLYTFNKVVTLLWTHSNLIFTSRQRHTVKQKVPAGSIYSFASRQRQTTKHCPLWISARVMNCKPFAFVITQHTTPKKCQQHRGRLLDWWTTVVKVIKNGQRVTISTRTWWMNLNQFGARTPRTQHPTRRRGK